MSAAAPQLGPGGVLGRYRIVAPLMEGGMAALFMARPDPPDPALPEIVALKVMRGHLARDPAYVTMFEDEGQLIARLGRSGHLNLLRFFELGRAQNGAPFLAIEYVEGVSLAQLLLFLLRSKRAMSPAVAVHIVLGVARALHVAHELRGDRGEPLEVIHRDVSPQNILLSTIGDVKLIDFGVAKARGRQWETAQGSLKGKLGYMSPEQARAEKVDRRTDVYALGVVLWEALVGQRLFVGTPDTMLKALQSPQIVSPRTHLPSLPASLDEVVMRALAPSPGARFPTAAALEAALVAAMPEVAAPGSPLPRVLGQLVCTALAREVEDDVEEERRKGRATMRELVAQRIAAPDVESALALHTREVRLAPAAIAPPTRVIAPPSASPVVPQLAPASTPRWVLPAIVALAALIAVPATGALVWWVLSSTLSRDAAPVAVGSAPTPTVAPPPPPVVPPPTALPLPSPGSSNDPMPPTGVDPPPDLDVEPPEAGGGESHRHRHGRDLPPPWTGPGANTGAPPPGPPPTGATMPPANRSTARRPPGPARLPPGSGLDGPQPP